MATFRCRLGTFDGKVIKQYFNALDEETLKKELEEKKYYIFEIKKKISLLDWITHSRRKIPIDDFVVFNQEFIALIKAGLTILQSLDILIRRRKKSYFRDMLEAVRSKIYSGASLSEAFRLQSCMMRSG